jgi:hypothetical protein
MMQNNLLMTALMVLHHIGKIKLDLIQELVLFFLRLKNLLCYSNMEAIDQFINHILFNNHYLLPIQKSIIIEQV